MMTPNSAHDAHRITSALEAATAGLTFADYAPAIAAFLRDAIGTAAGEPSRMDRAYAVARSTYRGGTT